MTAETHGVRVVFEPGVDPPLYDAGDSRAACLLYRPKTSV
jgi:peptide/nickel transport system ATP-binding protein